MYHDHKHPGDHPSVAKELLAGVPELEQKCLAVEKAVKEGYFPLQKALEVFKVSQVEFLSYFLLKHNEELKNYDKQSQVYELLQAISLFFNPYIPEFDQHGKNVMDQLNGFFENRPPGKTSILEQAGIAS
jgi:hypothetical protein